MGKGKLAKFADMEAFENVFQYPFSVIDNVPFEMKGHWRDMYFNNSNPIVLELGCGRGEYAVGLARKYPDINFIGVDIKGARMWTGAKQALDEGLKNVAFLRTNIEIIDRFFDKDEVQQIWLTFSDPQMKHVRKRLTSTTFIFPFASRVASIAPSIPPHPLAWRKNMCRHCVANSIYALIIAPPNGRRYISVAALQVPCPPNSSNGFFRISTAPTPKK